MPKHALQTQTSLPYFLLISGSGTWTTMDDKRSFDAPRQRFVAALLSHSLSQNMEWKR
jgi:hypothetical protein